MEKRKKVELLAPAGNPEGFYGSLYAGADAVYLGGSRFGARAYADNFTTEELVSCIRYGHLLGRKIYLTVNTLVKERELPGLFEYLTPFYEAGLDGVIIQDMGVFAFVREHFPGLELHASTQMTICDRQGAALLKDMGAVRIVPARELSLHEIKSLKKEIPELELETFVHGAMCYCYSGQCLFSSILGGRSGNRGRCAQPCRLPYSVTNGEGREGGTCYPLSLKDMCTIEHIPDLIEAGIDSFKIEGRMKKPEYAAGVTALYRKYIDIYYALRERMEPEEAKKAFRVEQADLKVLSSLYIRSGIHDGYYAKHNGREMITLDSPAYSGSDDEMLQSIRETYLAEKMRLPVEATARLVTGEPACVTFSAGNVSACAVGDEVMAAQNRPVTEENVRRQLGKLGDTSFELKSMKTTVSEDAFFPLKQVNELRREAVQLLEEKLLAQSATRCSEPMKSEATNTEGSCSVVTKAGEKSSGRHGYVVSVSSLSQLAELAKWQDAHPDLLPGRIYVDADLTAVPEAANAVGKLCTKLHRHSEIFLALPYILRKQDDAYLKGLSEILGQEMFDGILVRSLDGLGFVRESIYPDYPLKKCRADAGMYVWNAGAAKQLEAYGIRDGFTIPYELKAAEQYELLDASGAAFEKIVYSRIPMMVTANCIRKTTGSCRRQTKTDGQTEHLTLTDRYRKQFPVAENCLHCLNIIYNSVPLSLWSEREKWLKKADVRLDFTIEAPEEMHRILSAFLSGDAKPSGEYTTGHEKRGVE